jgi:hypothetical protein
MTPDITAASRRARLRQDRCAPLRGGLRPVLTQSLLGALIAHGPGQKAALHAELKASWGLPTGPRLKNGKAGSLIELESRVWRRANLAAPVMHFYSGGRCIFSPALTW